MKAAYYEMIGAFWRDSKLSTKTTTRVIKLLIPKNQQMADLANCGANWHPLTMLSLTEKGDS